MVSHFVTVNGWMGRRAVWSGEELCGGGASVCDRGVVGAWWWCGVRVDGRVVMLIAGIDAF